MELRKFIANILRECLNEDSNYKITNSFVVDNIISPMLSYGFDVKIIGSVAKKGYSKKDVDILLKISSKDEFSKFENFLAQNGWEYKFSDENEDNIEWGIFHNYEKTFNNVLIGMDVFIVEDLNENFTNTNDIWFHGSDTKNPKFGYDITPIFFTKSKEYAKGYGKFVSSYKLK